MVDKKLETIKFEYKILPSYNSYAISGAHGGLNSSGEVVVNFFHERASIPKKQEYQVRNGHIQEPPIFEEKKDDIIRDVLFGVSMSPATARSLADWLNEKADLYDKKLSQQKQEDRKK